MAQIQALNNDTLVRLVPAIGATEPMHDVSERYSFIPTLTAINHLRDAGWLPVMAQQAKTRKASKSGFQKHLIRFTRPDLVVGEHRMDLLLYNSHDRGCSFKLVGGVFRFVCANGMVVGDTMAEFSHRHVNFSPEKFIESAQSVNGHVEKAAGVIDDWQSVNLDSTERHIFAETAHSYMYPKTENSHAPIQPHQLLIPKRFADSSTDLWTTFNTVQEHTIKGGIRGKNAKGRNTTTRGVKSLDKDKRLNQALWQMAENMRKLKN